LQEQPLSRIPFLAADVVAIRSMVRWMRFIGAFKVIVSLAMGFVVLVGMIYVGAGMGSDLARLGGAGRLIAENRATFFALDAFALLLTVAGVWLGFVLYQAADAFEQVALTDEADQDYVTAGIVQLNTYLKISILLGLAAALVALAAGVSLVARYSQLAGR
jgi:hypothetical protein